MSTEITIKTKAFPADPGRLERLPPRERLAEALSDATMPPAVMLLEAHHGDLTVREVQEVVISHAVTIAATLWTHYIAPIAKAVAIDRADARAIFSPDVSELWYRVHRLMERLEARASDPPRGADRLRLDVVRPARPRQVP